MKHSLTTKDPEARTATCAVCGPVKIQRSGNGWACGNRANAQSRKQKAKNPDRDRASKTEHALGWKSAELLTGECAKCGAVSIVANGRGYMCANRAKELGRVNPQDAPQEHCRDCMAADGVLVWKSVDGCARCAETDLNALLAQQAADERVMAGLDQDDWGGMHLEGVIDPYYVPEYESAVPGWRTLGAPV